MKKRILTALIAAPVVLVLILSTSPVPITILALCVAGFAMGEVSEMSGDRRPWIAMAGAAGTGAFAYLHLQYLHTQLPVLIGILGGLFAVAVCWMLVMMRRKVDGWLLGPASVWIMAPLLSLLALHFSFASDAAWALNPLLLGILPLWASDTAAIFVGRRWGRRLLAPSISPNKTWEGAVAGLIASIVLAAPLALAIGLSLRQGLLVGLLAGVLGPAGDLFESAVKRRFAVKDSGSVLPGHGGMLDRIDSILFPAIPITALLLLYR